jgi:hypothetical protein
VDKKIALNLKGVKDSISNILKSRPLDIKNRISILSRINKMLYSNSYQEVDKYKNEVKTTITNIPSMDTNVKTELKEFVEQFKELKTAQIYRRKLSSFNKGMDNLEEKSKEEFNDLSSEAEQLERPSDFKEMNGKLRELKKTAPDQQKDFIKELGEISDLKLETSVSERTRDLKEKIEASKLYQNKIEELKEGANNIRDDRDHQGLSEDFREFKEKSEREKINADGELKELLEIKTYHLAKEIKESIEDILKESALSDAQKEEFLKELEKLESDKDLDKLISDTKKLQAHIDKLQNQGFIFPEARDELIKEIDQLKDISGLQFDTRQTGLELARQTEQSDISKKLEETLERLPLNTAVKDTLKKLSQELAHADNLEKMESIVQRAEREIQALSKEEKEKIKVFKELFESMAEMKKIHIIEKAFSDIRKDAEKLREMDLKQGATIEEHLNKIRDSSTLKEFKERLGDLTKYINSLKTRPIPEEMQQQRRLWQIYIMPSGAVVPIEQSVSLRAIAVFNNIFVQEISSELAWSSSDPNVAWIDAKGTIHALSRGKTKITAKYKGKIIDGPEITVVDKLSQDIEEIKKYVQ